MQIQFRFYEIVHTIKLKQFNLTAKNNIFLYSTNRIDIMNDCLFTSLKLGLFSGGNITLDKTDIVTASVPCSQQCDCLTTDSICDLNQKYGKHLSFLNQSVKNFDLAKTMAFYNLKTPQLLIEEMVKTNYSIVLIAENEVFLSQSTLNGSRIGIYSNIFMLKSDSHITAKGKGCQAGVGFGCAYQGTFAGSALGCGGAGASYGSMGGQAISNTESYLYVCYSFQPRQQYASFSYPILEGSGGGGTNAGSGGGVIFIESIDAQIDGIIDASGNGQFEQNQQDFAAQGIKGGGSGGSIQVHASNFHGKGYILSDGGGATNELREQQGTGGPGSGGRILINVTSWWMNKQLIQNIEYPQVRVQGGKYFRSVLNQLQKSGIAVPNLNGSIYTTICPPGYEINQITRVGCVSCSPGYFKIISGPQKCKKCLNDNGRINFNRTAELQPQCRYDSCLDKYNFHGGECLTLYEKFKKNTGGDMGITTLTTVISILLLSVIVISVKNRKNNAQKRKRLTQRDSLPPFDPSSLTVKRDESSAKPEFIVQDLPYHIRRLFLQGENTLENPWYLHQDSIIVDHMDGLEPLLIEDFILNLNMRAKYNNFLIIVMNFLKCFYYPFYYYMLLWLKKLKYVNISKYIIQVKISKFNTNQTGYFIKFTASPDYCLAFIDVLNYRQDPLEWNNQTKFPVSLVLGGLGSFLFPMQIYQRDPLVSSLDFYFQNKRLFVSKDEDDSDDEQSKENDDDEVNDVASFDEFIVKFNYRAKFVDFNQTQTSFIQNFKELISFIEYQNDEIFKYQGISIDLCVHLIADEVKFPNLQSKIIMLSKLDQDLGQTLKEVHQSKNYGVQYETRFSINFEKHDGPIDNDLYTEQVVLVTQPHLNAQIEEYKLYEDEREELNNLKLKMIRRMDRVGGSSQGKVAINYINTLIEEEVPQKLTCQEYVKQTGTKINRFKTICFSYFIRYSPPKFNLKVLIFLLIFCCLIQLSFAVIYPIILAVQLSYTVIPAMLWFEVAIGILFFPLSWLIAPIILCIWGMTLKTSMGKKFIVMNYCALIWSILEFLIGTLQIFEDISLDQALLPFINLVKMGVFLNINAMAFLACYILNHDNYNSMVSR